MKPEKLLKYTIFIVSIGAIIIGLFSIIQYIRGPQIYDIIEYDATLEVAEGLNLGIDTSTDRLGLGKGIPGSSQQKTITISHTYDETLLVNLVFTGEPLADWVTLSNQSFNLSSGEVKNVTVSATIPMNASVGTYDGTLKTYFIKE